MLPDRVSNPGPLTYESASMSFGCTCLLVFSAYLNEDLLCLTRIIYRFKQCN